MGFITSAVADQNDTERSFLRQTLPLPHEMAILVDKSPSASFDLVSKQLKAISKISNSPEKEDILLLIPYLNYTMSPKDVIFLDPPTIEEDLQKTRRTWPVFSAIVDNPFARDELKAYILNNRNPLNIRITSLLVLRYVDRKLAVTLLESLDSQLARFKPEVQNYASAIKSGQARFRGIVSL